MHYTVAWTSGSCNDGDHDHGWESFDTLEAAHKKIEDLKNSRSDGEFILISGEVISTEYWGM